MKINKIFYLIITTSFIYGCDSKTTKKESLNDVYQNIENKEFLKALNLVDSLSVIYSNDVELISLGFDVNNQLGNYLECAVGLEGLQKLDASPFAHSETITYIYYYNCLHEGKTECESLLDLNVVLMTDGEKPEDFITTASALVMDPISGQMQYYPLDDIYNGLK
jgi:hypothetical protein